MEETRQKVKGAVEHAGDGSDLAAEPVVTAVREGFFTRVVLDGSLDAGAQDVRMRRGVNGTENVAVVVENAARAADGRRGFRAKE